jgi:hypothetical protein
MNHGAWLSVPWGCDRPLGRFHLYQMLQFSRGIATSVSYVAIIENLYYSLQKFFLGNPAKNADFFCTAFSCLSRR